MEKVKIIDFPFKHQRYLKANSGKICIHSSGSQMKAKTGNFCIQLTGN